MPACDSFAPDAVVRSLVESLSHLATVRAHERAFTFVEYPDLNSPGRHRTLTWSQLDGRAQAVAAQLAECTQPGDRAVLLLPQGLDYVSAFLGCLRAQVVAVPLFPPDVIGHADRIVGVLRDCEPACAFISSEKSDEIQELARQVGIGEIPLLRVGQVHRPMSATEEPSPARTVPSGLDDTAYLQYTSGSTRAPAGVMISHRNVVANALQALATLGTPLPPSTAVSWLPLFHDMGLMLGIAAPVVGGYPSVLMDPVSFLQKPERWLRLLGQYPGAISAAPNFAYDYCVAKVDRERVSDLRLDRVQMLINGSEPIRPHTVGQFHEAFAGTGLSSQVHRPSYGLAEATVFVTTGLQAEEPRIVTCQRDALAEGRIESVAHTEVTADAVTMLMSCGQPVGQELRIIDPRTGVVVADSTVGEIVLRGPNIAQGYWKRAEQTSETFGTAVPGTGEQPWLRTGDLGAIHEGRLLVTGRRKDLLIVDGRNHYPQDVEDTIRSAMGGSPNGRIAVFSVPGDTGEHVIAVAERRRDKVPQGAERTELEGTVRGRVAAVHGLRLEQLVLVSPATVPRTSSGKVARSECRAAFLRGQYQDDRERQSTQ